MYLKNIYFILVVNDFLIDIIFLKKFNGIFMCF